MTIRISVYILLAVIIVELVGCGGGSNEVGFKSQPNIEITNFAYIRTDIHSIYRQNREDVDDVTLLNRWLRANPDKKVISFSGVLAYREGVSGYIVYFVPGDSSQQKFARISLSYQNRPESAYDGVLSLQRWKNDYPGAKIVAISTVPSYGGGVKEFTCCYEQ